MVKLHCFNCEDKSEKLRLFTVKNRFKNLSGFSVYTDPCPDCSFCAIQTCLHCGSLIYKAKKDELAWCPTCDKDVDNSWDEVIKIENSEPVKGDIVYAKSNFFGVSEGDRGVITKFDYGADLCIIKWDNGYKGVYAKRDFFLFRLGFKDASPSVLDFCSCGGPEGHVKNGIHCRLWL